MLNNKIKTSQATALSMAAAAAKNIPNAEINVEDDYIRVSVYVTAEGNQEGFALGTILRAHFIHHSTKMGESEVYSEVQYSDAVAPFMPAV